MMAASIHGARTFLSAAMLVSRSALGLFGSVLGFGRCCGQEGPRSAFLVLAVVVVCGCRSVPPPKRSAGFTGNSQLIVGTNQVETNQVPTNQARTNAVDGVFVHFPKETQKFSFWTKCNPAWWLGNADDLVPPENYRKGKCCRQFMWHMRNPCHNFTFYVIGIEDKAHVRVGKYPTKVANPNGGWNWAVCEYKRLRLPFVDYKRGRFEFYCGWRNGGNFGMKLNLWQGKGKKKTRQ